MTPTSPNALLDGQFKVCWNGIEWESCFFRGGTRTPDIEEREFEANCGTIKTLKKVNSISFEAEFTSWNCNHLANLAPHLTNLNGTPGTANGLITGTSGCTSAETCGPLYIEFLCTTEDNQGCNTIFYPNACINILEEDIDFTDDGGVVISVSWTALPAPADAQFPGVIEIIGQPDAATPMTYDCATGMWV